MTKLRMSELRNPVQVPQRKPQKLTKKTDAKETAKSESEEKKDAGKDDAATSTSKDTVEKKDDKEKEVEEKKKEPEPAFENLSNPARVMRAQLKVLTTLDDSKYAPMKEVSNGGIIVLRNCKPGESEDIVENVAAGGPKVEDEDEPEPPEPFEWTED